MKHSVFAAAFAALCACAPAERGAPEASRAVIVTSLGEITVELDGDAAPVSSANFASLARAGVYDGGSFYRAVRPDNDRPEVEPMSLIQGGHSFDGLPEATGIAHESTLETGLSHTRGAISMARFEPGTATSEFFIMVADYPGLDAGPGTRNPDEQGYAVFGRVVEGMDVVEAIWGAPTSAANAPEDFNYAQFLNDPVRIETVRVE
ncbi:MAG: peptidylprolyl isomerase [Oceanicaulis sp.]